MKAFKISGYILDFEDVGYMNIKHELDCVNYATISGLKMEEVEIGEWSDAHPLNNSLCDYEEYFNALNGSR